MGYQCVCCGQIHEGLPDIGSAMPYILYDMPEEERKERVQLTADTCIVDEEDYFIRGIVEVPVHGQEESFGFGVWVSQKKEHFHLYQQHPNSSEIGPFFGWLCTEIKSFPFTISLKTMAHFQGQGLRPSIELEPTEHPFAIAQREGISLNSAWEIVHEYLAKSINR
ncbi:DUF2199 domain-containing protein [Hymenobacter sp. HD11105]